MLIFFKTFFIILAFFKIIPSLIYSDQYCSHQHNLFVKTLFICIMSIFHDEVEIEDMEYDEETETYYYPCPCGDKFEITKVYLILQIFPCVIM